MFPSHGERKEQAIQAHLTTVPPVSKAEVGVPWFTRADMCKLLKSESRKQPLWPWVTVFHLSQDRSSQELRSNLGCPNKHWRRKWQPTPVFLPGKSHGRRNLVGYSPWGCKESDMTEWLHFHLCIQIHLENNFSPFFNPVDLIFYFYF